jgi:hypothetical protein
VTRQQLRTEGWTDDAIRWRVTSGRWSLIHRGVYLTTPGRDDWEVAVVAALLAVGSPSCLVGTSAGEAWGLLTKAEAGSRSPEPRDGQGGADGEGLAGRGSRTRIVTVAVPLGRSGRSLPGITVSRSRQFHDRVHQTEWPHRTTVEHTVFDLSLGHGPDRCIALMAKACQLRLATEESLASALEGRPRQPHRGLLREALGLVGDGAESAAEVRFARDVEQAHGLPTGERQEPAPGARSRDSSYDEWGVVVEVDGRLGHVGWLNQQRDKRRDRKAAVGGTLTVRGGWPDVAVTPCEFAADLGEIFATRGWTGRPRSCGREGCNAAADAA